MLFQKCLQTGAVVVGAVGIGKGVIPLKMVPHPPKCHKMGAEPGLFPPVIGEDTHRGLLCHLVVAAAVVGDAQVIAQPVQADGGASHKAAHRAGCKATIVPDLDQPGENILSIAYAKADSLLDVIDMIK